MSVRIAAKTLANALRIMPARTAAKTRVSALKTKRVPIAVKILVSALRIMPARTAAKTRVSALIIIIPAPIAAKILVNASAREILARVAKRTHRSWVRSCCYSARSCS